MIPLVLTESITDDAKKGSRIVSFLIAVDDFI